MVSHAPHPFGVTVFQSYVYWTDWFNKSVYRAPISGEGGGQEVRKGLRGALELRSVSAQRQPQMHNPCQHENGGCTHLCLFRERSYVCACPDRPDGRECKAQQSTVIPYYDLNNPTDAPAATDTSSRDKSDSAANQQDSSFLIVATCVLTVILIIVVIAILFLVLNSRRKKEDRSTSESSRSMLTFSNPNYNCADGQQPPPQAAEGSSSGSSGKGTIWRRLKYEKATVSERV